MYIKKQGWKPIHKKYTTHKNTKTQATKEHNNQDTSNTHRKEEEKSHVLVLL
jgi:hypothetical protein